MLGFELQLPLRTERF